MLDYLEPKDIIRLGLPLLELGAKIAMIKCGYKGLYIVTSEKEKLAQMGAGNPSDLDNWSKRQLWHPVYEVRPKDFVGALGSDDSAIGGFYAAYLREHKIEDCLRYGNAASSRNVTVPDGLFWNKGFDDLTERIRNWGSDPLDINESGWRRENELWIGERDKSNQKSW